MASKNKVTANRKNAKKSTGPKTAADKKAVKMNPLSHGLQAESLMIPGEQAEA